MLCRGNTSLSILLGGGGLGKTHSAINVLKTNIKNGTFIYGGYRYLNTHITPLALYSLLYKHCNDVIILDDITEVFLNDVSRNILMGATWEVDGKRIVTYESSDLKDLPNLFEFKGAVVVIANRLPNSAVIEAFKSRGLYHELQFTYKEKLALMSSIVKEPYKDLSLKQREKALQLLIKSSGVETKNLNFRTLIKTYNYLKYDECKAEYLIRQELEADEEILKIKEWAEQGLSTAEQTRQYQDLFHKTRRSYFRKKGLLLREMGVS